MAFTLYVNCDSSQTGAGLHKFCVIRSYTRNRSQFLKDMSGVALEKSDFAHLWFQAEMIKTHVAILHFRCALRVDFCDWLIDPFFLFSFFLAMRGHT